MPGRIARAGNLIPAPRTPGGGAPLGPPAAAQTVTVPRYPGGIDDVGTGKTLEFGDDATVLVSLYQNFLAAVVQSIETEIGPIATKGEDPKTWVAGSANLRDMLDGISLGDSVGKGRLVGVKRWSKTKIGWGGQQTLSLDVGHRPPNTPSQVPVWAYSTNAGGRTIAEMLTGPTSVRGAFAFTVGSNVFGTLSAAKVGNSNPGGGGAPTSGASFTVEGLLFFMPMGSAAR